MIRFANIEDAEEITKLHMDNIKRTYKGIYPDIHFENMNIRTYLDGWIEYLKRQDCRTIVCCKGDEILGFAAVCLYYCKEQMPLLDKLHVKASAEKQGIGSFLINAVFGLLKQENIDDMIIYCVEGNKVADQFYKHKGAIPVGAIISKDGSSLNFSNCLKIQNIINRYKKIDEELFMNLDAEYELLEEYIQSGYILWGVGNYYNRFLSQLGDKYKPIAIYDNNSDLQGLAVNGVMIKKPEKTSVPIVITVSRYEEVEKQIQQLGCGKSVRYYPWHNYMKNKGDVKGEN